MTASSLTGMSELTDRGKASGDFDWSEISPTIFGAVFESTWNPETRRSGGMHQQARKEKTGCFLAGIYI